MDVTTVMSRVQCLMSAAIAYGESDDKHSFGEPNRTLQECYRDVESAVRELAENRYEMEYDSWAVNREVP